MIKKITSALAFIALAFVYSACDDSESKDRVTVNQQQKTYQAVQPVHIYDYSIPRNIYQQIYDITTTKVVATYTVVESTTGVTRYECPSMGYAIPADVQLTNPLQPAYSGGSVIEQAEPNGLFSSKNTDGTWIMCVDLESSQMYPVYTEHKVSTFPFIVKKDKDGQWIRADRSPIAFTITIKKSEKPAMPAEKKGTPPIAK